jgi:hypothetical protein
MALRNFGVHDPHGAREHVEEMLRRHDPFNSIEAFIDSAELHADVKAALWLLAWSEQSYLSRSWIVREALAAATRPQG